MADSANDRRDDEVDDKKLEQASAAEGSEPDEKAEAADASDRSDDEESAEESKQAAADDKKAGPAKKADASGKMTVPQSPKAKAAAPAVEKKPEPGLMTPTNVALLLAAGGLLAFWKGVTLYKSDGKDYYSGSAWLFVIAFFAVTVSAFHFLGGQMPKPGEKIQKLETRLLESLVPALPFFALYAVIWWVAWDTWKLMYPGNSWMWMFFLGIGACSWGTWHALKPPSPAEVQKDELPTRRVILLIMVPFVAVFGMIWLAEKVAGH